MLTSLRETELIERVERFSLKCVNVLELRGDRKALDTLNGEIRLGRYALSNSGFALRAQIECGGFLNIVELAGEGSATWDGGSRSGAILSIDTIRPTDNWQDVRPTMDAAHEVVKELFFGLLKPEIVEEWRPVWNSQAEA